MIVLPLEGAAPPAIGAAPSDPLNTVGIALLAYGLVQIIAKVIDKLPWRGAGYDMRAEQKDRFSDEDRKRLERTAELLVAESQRLERMQELLNTQQRLTGQVLDEVRVTNQKIETNTRKLRALWNRIGRRGTDGT